MTRPTKYASLRGAEKPDSIRFYRALALAMNKTVEDAIVVAMKLNHDGFSIYDDILKEKLESYS